jgi:hypothetical protein
VGQATLPEWESDLIDEAISSAEERLQEERSKSERRAVQLAREQGYHRLAVAIDHPPDGEVAAGQLSLWPQDPTLFDDAS